MSTVRANGVTTELGLCLDGSNSILPADFDIIKAGVAEAIRNNLPHDGTVELCVIQFGVGPMGTDAQVEVFATVIDSDATAEAVATTVEGIVQGQGWTPTADGLYLTWETMKPLVAAKQVINLATNGFPTHDLQALPSPYGDPYDDAEWVVHEYAVPEGLDECDAEGIGVTADSFAWLRDELVYPQPGYEAPPWPDPYEPGWAQWTSDATEFANAIGMKFEVVVPPIPEFSIAIPVLTSLATAIYLGLRKRFAK